jgi:hypothetical protein
MNRRAFSTDLEQMPKYLGGWYKIFSGILAQNLFNQDVKLMIPNS